MNLGEKVKLLKWQIAAKRGENMGNATHALWPMQQKRKVLWEANCHVVCNTFFFVKVALISLKYTTPNEKPWQSQDVIFKGIPSVLMGKVSSGLQYHYYHPRSVWIRGAQRADGRRQNIDFPLNFYITPEGEIQHINFGMHFSAWPRETQKGACLKKSIQQI